MMDLNELTAREEIRQLLAAYTWAGDRGRIEELADLFCVHGVLDVGPFGGRWEGRSAIITGLRAVVNRSSASVPYGANPSPVRHHVSSILITDVGGGRARVRSYFVHTAVGLDHWGRYFDEVSLELGHWRFAQRMVVVDGASDRSLMVPSP